MTTRTLDNGTAINDARWYVTTEDTIRGPFATKTAAEIMRPVDSADGEDDFARVCPGYYTANDCDVCRGDHIDNDDNREAY